MGQEARALCPELQIVQVPVAHGKVRASEVPRRAAWPQP